jgi:hypothetical protein
MPAVADAVGGITVDAVDSGAGAEFERPEQAIRPRGPIANALDGRLSGSSRQVDAAGERVTQAGDATVNERVNGGPA